MENKKYLITLIILIVVSFSAIIFTYHDDFLYKQEILKITRINTVSSSSDYNDLGLKEKIYTRSITGIVTNTKDKGKSLTYKYDESTSSVVTEKFSINDKVFINKSGVQSLKRDTYIVLMICLFVILVYAITRFSGLLAILSVLLNIIIFSLGLDLYFKGINLFALCIIEEVVFTFISFYMITKRTKKTKVAILSVLSSMLVLYALAFIVIKLTKYNGLNFNELNFLTVPLDDVFMAELMIGALGAIMDVSITIIASFDELTCNSKTACLKLLKEAEQAISNDVVNSMINVLFFTYLCSGLPIFVLAIRNGFSFYNYITTNFTLEFARFLLGAIGIVITIPITKHFFLKFYKGSDIK